MCNNRTKSKTDEFVDKGAVWCDTHEIVLLKVKLFHNGRLYPADVEEWKLLLEKREFSNRCRGKIF